MDSERIASQLTATLDLVELNRLRLSRAMRDSDDQAADPSHVKLALDLARASVELSKEARAWSKQHKDLGKKLSLQERLDLTVAFLSKLTHADLNEVLTRIGRAHG
jgi:hypothetical protein